MPHPDALAPAVPLWRDRSFAGMTLTQFLGAFNDNAFKQTILLMAVIAAAGEAGDSKQALAMGLFSLPFLLFSGGAGVLADRFGKRRIIIACKLGEIAVMTLGCLAFVSDSLPLLLVTLFLMGSQSAVFGPAKYGILPEMLRPQQLSRANGVILMTTYLAIILGTALAGLLTDVWRGAMWRAGLVFVAIAVVGTASSVAIRRLPASRPGLTFGHPLGELWPTLRAIWRDGTFLLMVLTNSFFWFMGGVIIQSINAYGINLMGLNELQTSSLLVTLSAGIAGGALLAAAVCPRSIDFRLAVVGKLGMFVALMLLGVAHHRLWAVHASLALLGVCGGMFGIPLQAYVQLRAPVGQKGAFMAASNFINWVLIFASAAYYGVAAAFLKTSWIPVSLGVLTALVAVVVLPRLVRMQGQPIVEMDPVV